MVEVLNTLLEVEGVGTHISHLEGEEIFGSTNYKVKCNL